MSYLDSSISGSSNGTLGEFGEKMMSEIASVPPTFPSFGETWIQFCCSENLLASREPAPMFGFPSKVLLGGRGLAVFPGPELVDWLVNPV